MKKKLIIILIMLLSLCGCSEKYEDTNGADNYDLQTLKIEDVFNGYSSSYSSSFKSKLFSQGKTITYKNFNGITDVYEFEQFTFGNSSRYIKVSFHINKGNAALVVRNGSKIIKVFEVNTDNQEVYVEVIGESAYLTAYGEAAEIVIDYEIYE